MSEWPRAEIHNNQDSELPPDLKQLSDNIGKALQEKWLGLTDTIGPQERTFIGFGWAEDVNEYLTSKGIDLTGLRIEVGPRGRVVSVFASGRAEPIFYRYFGDRSEQE